MSVEVGGLSNLYIDNILSRLPLQWDGVYSSDNIPRKLLEGSNDFIIVVNCNTYFQLPYSRYHHVTILRFLLHLFCTIYECTVVT